MDVERIRTLGSFVFLLFFLSFWKSHWKWLEIFSKWPAKWLAFESRKVHANFLSAPHDFQTFPPPRLKHRCSEILRWRGGGGRGWRKRSPWLRGNGIRGKREEETIFNVSVKFHEILNFEYLSGETLGYVITLYREIDIKNMIARVLRIISLRRYFIPYFFSFLFLVFLFFLQFLRRKSNGGRHKRITFHSTCHYGYNPCERESERGSSTWRKSGGKDGKGRFPVHDSISEVKASVKWRGVNSGVSPLFIPSNASFGTHHPFFEFHS